MKRKLLSTVLAVTMAVSRLTGCGQSGTNEATGAGAATTDAKTETYRVRIPIDSCDFSLAHYEADGEEADENFEHFSFERVEKYILPLLDAAEKGGELRVSASEISSPTSAAELARAIRVFIERDLYGVYHVTGTGRCTRFEFAKTILEYAGKSDRLTLLSREEAEDLRPMYSVLNNMMLRLDHVYEPKHWKEALREYFDELEGAER